MFSGVLLQQPPSTRAPDACHRAALLSTADNTLSPDHECVAGWYCSPELGLASSGLLVAPLACSPDPDQLTDTPRLLAKALLGTLRGLSQLAADGTRRTDLLQVAEHSIRAFVRSV